MKSNTLIKAIVFAGCAGAMAFCLYKSYLIAKEYRKHQEVMDRLDDAVRLADELKERPIDYSEELVETHTEQSTASESIPRSFSNQMSDFEDRIAEEGYEESINDDEETEDEEEVEELRFPPESDEAYYQYVDMKLADIRDNNTKRILKRMYELTYIPIESDDVIEANIIDDREMFFGEGSVRSDPNDLTIGDLIMYLATNLDTDLDGGVEYWIEEMFRNLGITNPLFDTDISFEIVDNTLVKVVDGESKYGIFMLDEEDMESVDEGIQQQFWDFCKKIMREEE